MDFHQKDSQAILSALLLVILIVGGYVMFEQASRARAPKAEEVTSQPSQAAGTPLKEVTLADSSKEKKLPAGFPENIPVERANIIDSYKAIYTNHNNLTQYTVSYISKSSAATLWNLYRDFLQKEGYSMDKTATDKNLGTISGTKGASTLSVVVSNHTKVTLVQVNYLNK